VTSNNTIHVGKKKDEFAIHLEFEPDPDKGKGATAEESLSWGSLEIWVRGKNLCLHKEEGELVQSIHWYLLPLIEWLAENWDPLLHEERLPNCNAGDDAWQSLFETRFPPMRYEEDVEKESEWNVQWQEWWLRHSLQSRRCGGLFPDVMIRRWQDMAEISWGNGRPSGIPGDVAFVYSRGVERLFPAIIAKPLHELLQKATDYLHCKLPSSERFREVVERVKAIANTPRDNRLAWLAGLGFSYEVIKKNWNRITSIIYEKNREAANYLLEVADDGLVIEGSCHAALMFGSAAPTLSEDDLQLLVGKLVGLYAPASEKPQLQELTADRAISFDEQPAWEIGYDLAERVIDYFSLEEVTAGPIDISMILTELGIRQEKIELSDKHVRGVSIAGPSHQPSILINVNDSRNDTLPGERFTLAHELCHILFDRAYGKKLAMVSDSWAPLSVEKRANAFAAMVLMPRELVRKTVTDLSVPLMSEQVILGVRKRFQTSFSGTLEHLKNLGWLDPVTAEQIAEAREDRLSKQEVL
jgi:Zn-dependent peptidase ImmA (M78 family)